MSLIDGYSFRIVARLGLAEDIGTAQMIPGEIGFDTDMKVFRIGDDTPTPVRVPTTKSLGDFDFTTAGLFTFNNIALANNGTIDGVDPSKLNISNGFIVRRGNNDFHQISFLSGDSSLQIVNGNGVAGNVDIRIHPDILALINNGGYLQTVAVSNIMTGNGLPENPISVKSSSTTQVGVLRSATNEEAGAGQLTAVAVTPANLLNLASDSAVINYLRGLFQTTLNVSTDATMSGSGTAGSPLSVIQATEIARGAAEIATQTETNAGVSDVAIITPAKLKGLSAGSPTAVALAEALGIALPLDVSQLQMTGPGILGRTNDTPDQAPQVLPFATRAKITANSPANDFDAVNQATMREYFPLGSVKPDARATNALPSAGEVGAGAIMYDNTRAQPVVSNGGVWQTISNPFGMLWQEQWFAAHKGTTGITVPSLADGDLVEIRHGKNIENNNWDPTTQGYVDLSALLDSTGWTLLAQRPHYEFHFSPTKKLHDTYVTRFPTTYLMKINNILHQLLPCANGARVVAFGAWTSNQIRPSTGGDYEFAIRRYTLLRV